MNAKLTLRLDEALIGNAKHYSDQCGKSVSKLVADYFSLLNSGVTDAVSITPRVRALYGALSQSELAEGDYHAHLDEKYR